MRRQEIGVGDEDAAKVEVEDSRDDEKYEGNEKEMRVVNVVGDEDKVDLASESGL